MMACSPLPGPIKPSDAVSPPPVMMPQIRPNNQGQKFSLPPPAGRDRVGTKPVVATPLTGNQWILLQNCNTQPMVAQAMSNADSTPAQAPPVSNVTSIPTGLPPAVPGGVAQAMANGPGLPARTLVSDGLGHDHGIANDPSVRVKRKRNSPTPWTEEEHRLFLQGLKKYGKGNWRIISAELLKSRTPIQIASHAQKYFEHISGASAKRRRTSIFATQQALEAAALAEANGGGHLGLLAPLGELPGMDSHESGLSGLLPGVTDTGASAIASAMAAAQALHHHHADSVLGSDSVSSLALPPVGDQLSDHLSDKKLQSSS